MSKVREILSEEFEFGETDEYRRIIAVEHVALMEAVFEAAMRYLLEDEYPSGDGDTIGYTMGQLNRYRHEHGLV